jgi:hypothetical protein
MSPRKPLDPRVFTEGPARRTWEQPLRTVRGLRWREGGATWVELVECGHKITTSTWGAKQVRCYECNPVRRNPVTPTDGGA